MGGGDWNGRESARVQKLLQVLLRVSRCSESRLRKGKQDLERHHRNACGRIAGAVEKAKIVEYRVRLEVIFILEK